MSHGMETLRILRMCPCYICLLFGNWSSPSWRLSIGIRRGCYGLASIYMPRILKENGQMALYINFLFPFLNNDFISLWTLEEAAWQFEFLGLCPLGGAVYIQGIIQ